jgi:hypothetical protein
MGLSPSRVQAVKGQPWYVVLWDLSNVINHQDERGKSMLDRAHELISIFVASVRTAEKNK